MNNIQLFDTVTNLKPIPKQRLTLVESQYQSIPHLPIGQVGTIVEIYTADHSLSTPSKYLIEFADSQGREYAMAVLQSDEMIVLRYELALA
jgi:Domain of unknown function (DUF4926)